MITGDYYLVARDLETGKVNRIPIDRSWYDKTASSEKIYGNDIAAIDYVTSKFTSKEALIHRLFTYHYIDTENVDLYITHKHKYLQKEFINEYVVIVNTNDRVNSLISLMMLKLQNQVIKSDNRDANDIINKLISKCFSNKTFLSFMTCPWSKVDKYLSDTIISYSKEEKINWKIKYQISDKTTNYLTLRNIISMWNLYDILFQNVKNYPLEEQPKHIVKLYTELLGIKDVRKDNYPMLREKIDKNYIEGQMNLKDYFSEDMISTVANGLQEMFDTAASLKNQPFDSQELQALEQKYGRFEITEHLTLDIIKSLSLKDRYILGFIDYVEYKNQMYNNENTTMKR